MTRTPLVGLVFEAWNDLDRVLAGLDSDHMGELVDGQSSFAWTLAHVTNQLDSWINVNFQRRSPHPLLSAQQFRMGSVGTAPDCATIQAGVHEVRAAARPFLQNLTEGDLARVIPYAGALLGLREHGLSLRYALSDIAAHHYVHIGVIACQRDRLGHQVGDYPGLLRELL